MNKHSWNGAATPTKFSSHITIMLHISCILLMSSQLVNFVDAVFNPATKPIISHCAATYHQCVVFDSKKMKCWGIAVLSGSAGVLFGESPATVGDAIPYFNPGSSLSISKVSCGSEYICMVLNTKDIKCAGYNSAGQVGIGIFDQNIGSSTGFEGDTLPFVNIGNETKVDDLVSGSFHNCVLTTDKKVKCFGKNDNGQLGLGDSTNRGAMDTDMGDALPFVDFGTNITVASLHSSSASSHNCVILSEPAQKVKCWGFNMFSQLGYGDTRNRGENADDMGDNLPLIDLGTESRVKQIAVGSDHTCALLVSSILKCFGSGQNGQLGSGDTETISATGEALIEVEIDQGKVIRRIEAGGGRSCIVYDDDLTLKCFGLNIMGELGQGDKQNRGNLPYLTIPFIPPVNLGTGSLKISSVLPAVGYTCVIFADWSIKCFGNNSVGQLGIGSKATIGDQPYEMGLNLTFTELFSPTQSPTLSPTRTPTHNPSKSPTIPTRSPTQGPTNSPTLPTQSPTKNPTTPVPTNSPTNSPTRSCNHTSSKLCKLDTKCAWGKINGNKTCYVFDCKTLSKGQCKKEKKKCLWDKKTKLCNFKS